MLNNENRSCRPVEKSPLVFSTPQTAVDLSSAGGARTSQSGSISAEYISRPWLVLLYQEELVWIWQRKSKRLQTQPPHPPKQYSLWEVRNFQESFLKVSKSKTSGWHQARSHLLYCFTVSPEVKGRGAECVPLTRCMCFGALMLSAGTTCCKASQRSARGLFVIRYRQYSKLMGGNLIISHMIKIGFRSTFTDPKSWHHISAASHPGFFFFLHYKNISSHDVFPAQQSQ